jgi:sulfoxide reductase heme-binding subunit YedZ
MAAVRAARARSARPGFGQVAAHVISLAPLIRLVYEYTTDVNPIQAITLVTGKTALVLLVLSLACTPANTWLGWRWAIKARRPLGVYASLYVLLHLLIFVGLDYGFDLELLGEALFEKRYAFVGLAAFALLVPVAITSTPGWQRRLGKRWKRLQRLVYVVALLDIIHYLWLVKADIRQPLAYGVVVVALLALRVPFVKRVKGARRPRPGR